MAILDNVASLFQAKPVAAHPSQPITQLSPDAKLQDETYVYYGTRICGKVTASLPALSAFLPRVYNSEKQRQIADEELQRRHKQELSKRLEDSENNITRTEAEIGKAEGRIADLNDFIAELKEKLSDAKAQHGEINKMAKVKLTVGLVILSILTLYLFIFYSSTFYSAFFKDFSSGDISIGAAMFDSKALPHALSEGVGELIFILCAPIIFMGLGYGLHFFMQQKSWTKFLKSGSVLAITFIFDCILAYLIAKKIYDVGALTKLGDVPDFSLGIAIRDVNVWAVIFCGFIVYLIWGIVFDMVMTAYEELRSNRKEIEKIGDKIRDKKELVSQEKQRIADEKSKLGTMQNRKEALIKEMTLTVHFDSQIIKAALSEFFTGWMTMMNGLNRPKTEQDEAIRIYNTTIQELLK